MNFIPEEKQAVTVPYFEDAKEKDGWQGQGTTKSAETLQSEIIKAIGRLGGIVSGFQRGTFQIDDQSRQGVQVHYSLKSPSGKFIPGRLDVAALPVRDKYSNAKKDKAFRMALYMLRESLDGMWLMQQLSPGYAALMPWMLADKDKTISQLWAESPAMSNLLPPGDAVFEEGEVIDA
jgi:hypothetical protein